MATTPSPGQNSSSAELMFVQVLTGGKPKKYENINHILRTFANPGSSAIAIHCAAAFYVNTFVPNPISRLGSNFRGKLIIKQRFLSCFCCKTTPWHWAVIDIRQLQDVLSKKDAGLYKERYRFGFGRKEGRQNTGQKSVKEGKVGRGRDRMVGGGVERG